MFGNGVVQKVLVNEFYDFQVQNAAHVLMPPDDAEIYAREIIVVSSLFR